MAELTVMEIEKAGRDNKIIKMSEIFNKTSQQIARLVYKLWFTIYPHGCKVIYNNGSGIKLYFHNQCDVYGLKRKPTTIENTPANAILILEHVYQVIIGNSHNPSHSSKSLVKSNGIQEKHIYFVATQHKIGVYRQQ